MEPEKSGEYDSGAQFSTGFLVLYTLERQVLSIWSLLLAFS
jgi:hypothetical protein